MTEAAEKLHLTQPALSKQLKVLEAEFGAPLLMIKRGQKGIYLTEAGRVFRDQIQQLCDHETAAREAVKRLTNVVDGTLRISVSASRATPLIQQALQYFHTDYPSVRFEMYEGLMDDLTIQLLTGAAELGICSEQLLPRDKFDILYKQKEEVYAVFRHDLFWENLDKEYLMPDDLQGIPLSLSGGSVKMLMQTIPAIFPQLEVTSVSTSKSAATEWAASGKTVALIPMDNTESVGRPYMSRLKLQLPNTAFYKVVVKVKDHELSLVAQQFLSFYKNYCLGQA